MIEILTAYGLWGMLIAAFLAGSFFPFSSEAVMLGFMAAVPVEERFVRFENTRNPLRCLLRVVGGAGRGGFAARERIAARTDSRKRTGLFALRHRAAAV